MPGRRMTYPTSRGKNGAKVWDREMTRLKRVRLLLGRAADGVRIENQSGVGGVCIEDPKL